MQEKKIPIRKCIACGNSISKKDLLRIVRNPEGQVEIDPSGKKNGRGAYICKNIDCVDLALKKKKIKYALKSEISEEVIKELKDYVTRDN